MRKILIIGEYFSNNLGDAIICEVVENLFSEQYETKMIDLSGKTHYTIQNNLQEFNLKNEIIKQKKSYLKNILIKNGLVSGTNHIKRVCENLIKNFEMEYSKFKPDIILFAGGQMFMDYFLEQIKYIVNRAEIDNKIVIFNACGVGKITGEKNKKILSDIVTSKNVKYISVRDGYSKIKNVSEFSNLIETYDTAILTNKFFKKNTTKIPLGLGIMFVKNENIGKQIKFWSKMIQFCEKENIEWEAFSNGAIEDQQFIQFLFKINRIDSTKIHKKPENAYDLVKTITTYESIISMRLHSLIIAYSYNIPFSAISWDKKVNVFLDKINNSSMCFNLNDDIEKIFYSLKEFDNSAVKREEIYEKICENIDSIKEIIKSEVI